VIAQGFVNTATASPSFHKTVRILAVSKDLLRRRFDLWVTPECLDAPFAELDVSVFVPKWLGQRQVNVKFRTRGLLLLVLDHVVALIPAFDASRFWK
jgi:hypothetical protein